MTAKPGPRSITVAPERLETWLAGFAERHGTPQVEPGTDQVLLRSPDGAEAAVTLQWGPLPEGDPLAMLVEQCTRPRRLGALIVRRKAHAVGVFLGDRLLTGHHAGHYVQGRTKAGGWSQQRYARRRDNQADRSFDAAAADATSILLPELGRLEGLMLGGDRAAVAAVLARPGLDRLAELPGGGVVLSVPDPNAGVLAGFAGLFRRVRIGLNELA